MPAPPKRITMDDLEAFAIGAWILGTGGGGDPYFSLLEARQHWGAGRSVDLIDPLALDDDDAIACIGQMGAPIAMQEKMVDGPLIARTITMMEEHIGRKFKAIMMWEVGGNNGFQPFLAGSLLGLPVVDCDAMGRAFPRADMTTFAIRDLPAYPWTMIDIRANSVILTSAVDWTWMEQMTRKVCTVWGSLAATCKAPRTGRDAKDSACLHTATKAIRIGHAVQAARRAHTDPVDAVVKSEQGLLVFRGKVTDVLRRAAEGWLRGTVVIEGLDEHRGATFRVDFQNEWSIGWLNDEVKVTVPDLICLMDTVSGEAVGTETVRYGQRVSVIVLPAPAILMSPKGLKHVGPRAFGYDIDFKSIFPESAR
jgi:DUF917 family protein